MSTEPVSSAAHNDQATVLIVDDDHDMAAATSDILRDAGYRALTAHSGHEALAVVEKESPDVLITDLRMAGMSGHTLQAELKRVAPGLPVIVITAFGSIQTAVESMKLGAFDYITKPFSNGELLMIVARALEDRNLRAEVKRLRIELARNHGLENIIAASPKMTAMLSKLAQIADSSASVLITGESGTGKDLLARALHFLSPRHSGPFVPVNCAAIPESLIESELFGHARGAFTDAKQNKVGLFVAAGHGTLFLDEIGEMLPTVQAKLLRVIEDKKVRPLGATGETTVDVRVIAATNADLEKAVADNRFRSDLFYRIATVTIAVPPLRDRVEDIPLLIKHFLARAAAESGKPAPQLDSETTDLLAHYRWPGNIRELQNAIQQAVILCSGSQITRADLPTRITGDHHAPTHLEELANRRMTLEDVEREYARAVLTSVNNHRGEAAAILGVDRKTLTRKLEDPE
jgi:two-component system response regulator HydG